MSEALLVRHCSPTLAGLKTGNMFPAQFESRKELQRDLQQLNRQFAAGKSVDRLTVAK